MNSWHSWGTGASTSDKAFNLLYQLPFARHGAQALVIALILLVFSLYPPRLDRDHADCPHTEVSALLDKALAECKADKSWATFDLADTGHMAMFDAAELSTDLLVQVA